MEEKRNMSDDNQVDGEFTAKFTAAWNDQNIDLLMEFMADDCIFMGSVGDEIEGTKWDGRGQVKKGFANLWDQYPDAHFEPVGKDFITGDRGVAEWIFTGTRKSDGVTVKARGCDIFTFRGGKILVKNSFRKQMPPSC